VGPALGGGLHGGVVTYHAAVRRRALRVRLELDLDGIVVELLVGVVFVFLLAPDKLVAATRWRRVASVHAQQYGRRCQQTGVCGQACACGLCVSGAASTRAQAHNATYNIAWNACRCCISCCCCCAFMMVGCGGPPATVVWRGGSENARPCVALSPPLLHQAGAVHGPPAGSPRFVPGAAVTTWLRARDLASESRRFRGGARSLWCCGLCG